MLEALPQTRKAAVRTEPVAGVVPRLERGNRVLEATFGHGQRPDSSVAVQLSTPHHVGYFSLVLAHERPSPIDPAGVCV